ncbi:MAG: hypothetical protein WC869_00505 [Phycisphaerae bacterium]|jgi:hypothetical protein
MALPHQVVVYINGYRFDPVNVTVTFSAQEVCTFQVDVPPVPEWDLLLPRSHGAVFFLDPLTNVYRLMCEGEYVGLSRGKVGTGQRTRSLLFRGLHGFMEDTTFFNIVGVIASSGDTNQPTSALVAVSARANGSLINQPITANTFKTVGVEQIINNVSLSGNVSSGLLEIPRRLIAQTPVESYYFWARRMDRKMWTFLDTDLKAAMDYQRWSDFQKNALNTMGLGPSSSLMSVLQRYEELAFYQHLPIPAPPLYKTNAVKTSANPADQITEAGAQSFQDKLAVAYSYFIPELLFAPYLYNTIPPACNTLFNDQIKSVSGTLAFAAVPTRLVAQLAPPAASVTALPLLYMANDQYDVQNVSNQATGISALQQITHGMFSEEELVRGVRTVFDTLRYEKLQPSGEGSLASVNAAIAQRATLPRTIELMVRHDFNKARGQSRALSISSVFQPYLVPGFPAVIEDGNQPFRCMIQTVTHSMSPDGQPSTTIAVTHVEELLQVGSATKTAPLPAYLNSIYTPAKIADTYKNLFGPNLMQDEQTQPYATSVPPSLINQALKSDNFATDVTSVAGYTIQSGQVNLDKLLSAVVDVPYYDDKGNRLGNVAEAGSSIGSQLRLSDQPHEAFLKYQYRSGCSLRNWMIMHNLQTKSAISNTGIDQNPPLNIGNPISTDGDDVFGSPSWLDPNVNPTSLENFSFEFPQYGAYKAVSKPSFLPAVGPQAIISPIRQQKTSAIQAAILRGATNDTKLSAK